MQKRVVAILVLSLFKGILSYNVARVVDPYTYAVGQLLSDITLEIVPYQTYPYACPACPTILPYSNPCCPNEVYQCGAYPEYLYPCNPIELELPYCPTCLDNPCGMDTYPACNCYRDIKDPCMICEEPAPLCICLDCDQPPPYIYFPPVEYPMSVMDIRPYYYGNCWCN